MQIQINTDKTISGTEDLRMMIDSIIRDGLSRHEKKITRIEVHISDENGKKKGQGDKRCLLEARLEGKQPIAVSYTANQITESVEGAVKSLISVLSRIPTPH